MSNTDKVLEAITQYWRENSVPPAIRTIQAVTGISSTSLVRYYYTQLESMGAIKRIKGKPVPIQIYRLIKGESS